MMKVASRLVGAVGGGQAQSLGDVDFDGAGPHGVLGGRPDDQVGRQGHAGQEIGGPHPVRRRVVG